MNIKNLFTIVVLPSMLLLLSFIVIDIFFFEGFLHKYIYPLSMVVTSILLTWITYQTYKAKHIAQIKWEVHVIDRRSDLGAKLLPIDLQVSESTNTINFFLLIIVNNIGEKNVILHRLENEKEEPLHFFPTVNQSRNFGGVLLGSGQRYSENRLLTEENICQFKGIKKLYLVDGLDIKYPILKKNLIKILEDIESILTKQKGENAKI